MNEQATTEQTTEERVISAKLNLFTRLMLALMGCVTSYFAITAHFLFCVRVAHFLGDVSYIPPSVLRYTGVVFQQGEVEAGAQIVFFVVWLILVVVSCAVFMFVPLGAADLILGFFTDDKPTETALTDNFSGGFACLIPLALLSLLTLLIMPLESYHPASDSASLTQIGELLPFGEFLFTMTEATVIISLVCFFVVLTCAVAYLLSFIYDGGELFFFVSIFIGVCVGIVSIFVLGHYAYAGIEFLKIKTGNAYLTQFAVFGAYAALCAALILPWSVSDRKTDADKNETASAEPKSKKTIKNQNRQRANAVAN